jgi:DNA-directed RNA polymerase subunit RPC12/RpoP
MSEETPNQIVDFSQPDDGVSETCAICGRGYMLWHAPQPLWDELIGHYAGTRCPKCFDDLAREKDIRIVWTPMVVRREGVATTNWWSDPIRDRLLVGEPDPGFHDDERAQVPQGHWGAIARALGWPYESPYPDENRGDRMEGVKYRDSGVNAEAEAARG